MTHMKGLKGFNIFSNQRKAHSLFFLLFLPPSNVQKKKKSKQHLPKGDLDLKTVHYIIWIRLDLAFWLWTTTKFQAVRKLFYISWQIELSRH